MQILYIEQLGGGWAKVPKRGGDPGDRGGKKNNRELE